MAIVNTLEIADELARDGVFTREQAERLARVSARTAGEALATKADLAAAKVELENTIVLNRRELEIQIQQPVKEVVKWVAGILLAHGITVVGVTVTLVKVL